MDKAVVKLNNVSIKFGANEIIRDASFDIKEGDFCCLVGPNGAGKSTLMRGILGLEKINAGKIECDVSRVGYMPQEAKVDLNFPATAGEIVMSGNLGRIGKRLFYNHVDKQRAAKSLKRLGVSNLAAMKFGKLSGGQKQKILLARALTAAKDVLFLDEPSNNLDHESREEFYRILKELNYKDKMTIIMVTHDLDADDLIGNKVASIRQGRVELSKTSDFLRSFK